MAKIVLDRVTKEFGTEVIAVDDVSIEIGDGEFMVLVGPSGCGKSTILRLVAGLEEVTDGEIYIGERQVTDLPPKERDIALVFQNYALYPHMNVEQNIGFGLRLRKVPREEARRRVLEAARILGLEPFLERKPAALSGGQRQRVAMGRAMVREPLAFLMDEPLSNLDAKLRVQMRAQLALLRERLQTTTLYVTHDQVEAMTLGDRVAVLKDGLLQQVDTPQALFNTPANLFVAAFIGSPAMNLAEARFDGSLVSFAGFHIPVEDRSALHAYRGRSLIAGLRPSDFEDAEIRPDPARSVLEVTAGVTEDLGSEVNVLFTVDAPPVMTEDTRAAAFAEEEAPEDEPLDPLLADTGKSTFTARVDARTAARPGRRVRLSIDPGRLHFFDKDTGLAIPRERVASAARPLELTPEG
jgi:multiple sugar transport system ATP-binding protein